MSQSLVNSEYSEQCAVVKYLEFLQNQGNVIMFTAIPNSTWTSSWNQKRKNKLMGVRPGIPDLFILTRNNTLFLEMKVTGKKGVVSPAQKQWIDALTQARHAVYVAHGFNDARRFIDNNI